MDEAAFELPGAWTDKSVHVLSTTIPASGADVAFWVSRTYVGVDDDLGSLADHAIAEQRGGVAGLEVLERDEALTVAGAPAIGASMSFRVSDGPMYQRQVFVVNGGRFLTLTATARWKHRADCDATLASVLETLSFRRHDA